MKSELTIGTRGSRLALTQADFVKTRLEALYKDIKIQFKIIKTTGDKVLDKELSEIGGKGLFIKEIEEALFNNEIDLAVHSTKDVPFKLEDSFSIAAIMEREDPGDIIICKEPYDLDTLPSGSLIGTCSLRRILQLKRLRPDFTFKSIRGNIDTRIKKLSQGDYDAIVLAAAGLKRLGWCETDQKDFFHQILDRNSNIKIKAHFLDIATFIPAVGQGALLIEVRSNDDRIIEIIKQLNNSVSSHCVLAERSFLKEVNGGCDIPIGAYCYEQNNKLFIEGFIGDEQTFAIYRKKLSAEFHQFEQLGVDLAKAIQALMKE